MWEINIEYVIIGRNVSWKFSEFEVDVLLIGNWGWLRKIWFVVGIKELLFERFCDVSLIGLRCKMVGW